MKYTFLYMAGASLWNLFMTVLWLMLLLGCSEELHVPSPLRMRLGMGARGEQPSCLNEMSAFYISTNLYRVTFTQYMSLFRDCLSTFARRETRDRFNKKNWRVCSHVCGLISSSPKQVGCYAKRNLKLPRRYRF